MAKIKAHTLVRKFKSALTMLLVVAMLLPYFVMPASAVTLQNKSLQAAINNIIGSNDPTGYAVLDLSGTDIVGGINGQELKTAFPHLGIVKVNNTNITAIRANGITFESTDTFYSGTRKLVQKPGAESVYKANSVGGDFPVQSLIDQLEIQTASGERIPMPADMVEDITISRASTTTESSTITIADLAGKTYKPDETIPESLLKSQLAGTYRIELRVKTKDHIDLGTIPAEVTLKIMIEQYALTPPSRSIYEGGSGEFTLIYRTEDGDLRDLGSKDQYSVFMTDIATNNKVRLSDDHYTMDGRNEKMVITISSGEVDLNSTTRIEVCLKTDETKPIGRATISKIPNPTVASIDLREYSFDRGTDMLAPGLHVGSNTKLNFRGGTSLASKNVSNIAAGGTYTRTTKFLVGRHAPQIGTDPNFVEPLDKMYLSQMKVELGTDATGKTVDFSYNFSLETMTIEGKSVEVIILTLTATTPNARDYKYDPTDPTSTHPITVVLDNGNNSKAELFLDAQIHTNEPKGYKIYSLPAYYENFTKNEVEDIINAAELDNADKDKADDKVIEVAHYRKNSAGTDYEAVKLTGATVYEGGNIILIAAAYYEGDGEDGKTAVSIVPAPQTRGWYYQGVDPSQAFQTVGKNIGTTDMVAALRNEASMSLKGAKVLDISLAAGITGNQETSIIYAIEGGFGNLDVPVKIAESEVIEYIFVPKTYLISTGFTDFYHDLQAQIKDVTKVTRNSLYRINEEQQDTVPIGTSKTYAIYEVRNTYKSTLVAVTGSLKDEITSTDDTYFTLVDSANPVDSFVLEATIDGGKDDSNIGKGTKISYNGANGKKSPVVDVRLSESLITGIFVVYEDLFGNYYSNAQEIVDGSVGSGANQVDAISSIPSKHFEIPAGTEGAKAYNVFSFSNKKMYQDGNWKTYLVAAKYMDKPIVDGTGLEQPDAPAGSGGEPVDLETKNNLASYDKDDTYRISTRAFDPSMVPADEGGIHSSNDPLENTFVSFGNGREYDLGSAVENSQFTSSQDNIRVVAPIVSGMAVTRYDKTGTTELTDFIPDGIAIPFKADVIPGDTLKTNPYLLLSARTNTLVSSKNQVKFDTMKELAGTYLGSVEPDYEGIDDSILVNRNAAPKGDIWTMIFAKQSAGAKMQYRYEYELNGKWNYDSRLPAISENLVQTVANPGTLPNFNNTDPTVKASPYAFAMEIGKPKIWDVFMVAGDGLDLHDAPNVTDKALYTKPFRLADTDKSMKFYPVIVNSGIHANSLVKDLRNTKTMPTDREITPEFIEEHPEYANYMFTNDLAAGFRGATDPSVEVGVNGTVWKDISVEPDNGDQNVIINKTRIKSFADEGVGGKIYLRVDLLDEIYAAERLKARVNARFAQFDGTALSASEFTASGLAKYDAVDTDVAPVTTGHEAYFQHLDNIEHAKVVDMKTAVLGGPFKVGDAIPIKVEYAISSDINPTQGITTNLAASTFNRPGVDVLPGYPNYPVLGTPGDYNVLRFEEENNKSVGAQKMNTPVSNSIWYAVPNEAGDFVLKLTTINIDGAVAPLFTPRYHEVKFTVEPGTHKMNLAFGQNKPVWKGGLSSVDHEFEEVVASGQTPVLNADELRKGNASMADNVSRTGVKVRISEIKNGVKRFLYETEIDCYTSMIRDLKLIPATTAGRPKELKIGETISIAWEGTYETQMPDENGVAIGTFTVMEDVDPTTWKKLITGVEGELTLDGSTVTLTSADKSGEVIYRTTHPGLKAHPNLDETVYFYVKAIADQTVDYKYTFYTDSTDMAGSTITELEMEQDAKHTVYVQATKDGTVMTGNAANVNTAVTGIEGKDGTKAVKIDGTNSFEVIGFNPGVSDVATVTLLGGGEGKLPIKVKGASAIFTLSGIVKDASGSIISGATVTLNNGMTTTSGSDGSYSFSGLVAGTYDLTGTASGYESKTSSVTISADAVQDIVLTVQATPTYTISGKVTGSDTKAGIDGATVTVTGTGVSETKTTDANGDYSIIDLESGSYTVKIEAANYTADTQTVTIGSVDETHDVELAAIVYPLTGKVVVYGTGAALPGVEVEIDNTKLTTDANGEYKISITSGTYKVKATLAGYEPFDSEIVVDENAGTIGDIVMIPVGTARHTVAGNVSDKDDSTAVAGATVAFKKAGTTNLAYSATTGANGDYTIDLLPDTYDVTISKTGYQDTADTGLAISADKNDNDYEIEKIKVEVSGKVIIAGGTSPLSGATVTLTDAASGSAIGSAFTTNSNGEYKFTGVVAGSYIIKATATNYTANQTAAINVGVTDVTVDDLALTYVSPGGGGGSGGGGGGGTPAKTYTVTLADIENGTATVNKKSATSGTNMTITLTPVKGYELDWITVRDKDNKDIDVAKGRNDRTYTFKMPASDVTVTVKYKVEGSEGTDPDPTPDPGPGPGPGPDPTPNPSDNFTDLIPSEWYIEFTDYVLSKGYMNGTSATTFEPGAQLTRGMMVQLLYNIEGKPSYTAGGAFGDVVSGAWYYDAVMWAASNKIVTGHDATRFAPDDSITREQMAAIIYRYSTYKGYDTTATSDLSGLAGTDSISDYALTAIKWAVGAELMNGRNINGSVNIAPTETSTRAEVATLITRYSREFIDTEQSEQE